MTTADWWRGGVIYQIYPRSFQDSNGDGLGDLAGVVQRLPYLSALGVDAIWLSPFFTSPMKDFGYDVSDYRGVDPIFGTLDDFDAVVKAAHGLGIKVLIDQVLSHSSEQHPWFVESRSSRDNPRADWFVWAEPKPDGSPPNNWLSIFGGSAWQWDTRRQQYYLHNFLASQPDLNFHCAAVQEASLDNLRFWLDRGVDGFRFDTVNFYVHDSLLRDNSGRGGPLNNPAVSSVNPYAWQVHEYDKSRPENLDFLRRIRSLLDEYPGQTSVGEIGDDDSVVRLAEYTNGGDKLHMAYGFDLLGAANSARYVHQVLERLDASIGDGWVCWALGNHDSMRLASRWQRGADDSGWLRLAATLLLTLRGTPCIYQGEELGLTEATIAFDDLQDPFGITMWPEFKGRDGCRTPMPWDASQPNAGFTDAARTWLPMPPEHLARAVATEQADDGSLWHAYRRLLAWRRGHEALRRGALDLLPADDQVLAYVRDRRGEHGAPLLCLLNMSAEPARYAVPEPWKARLAAATLVTAPGLPAGTLAAAGEGVAALPAFGVLFAQLAMPA